MQRFFFNKLKISVTLKFPTLLFNFQFQLLSGAPIFSRNLAERDRQKALKRISF